MKPKEEDFLERLNSDTAFRNKFLDHPVDVLKEYGFPIGPEDEKKIEEAIGYLKNDIKHIFEIPSGYGRYLGKIGFGIKMPPRIEAEADVMKVW